MENNTGHVSNALVPGEVVLAQEGATEAVDSVSSVLLTELLGVLHQARLLEGIAMQLRR